MGKNQASSHPPNSHKTHKTLRDKLRKKRQQQKAHKKQKSQKHKQYNATEQKQQYFEQSNKTKDKVQENVKNMKKLNKYIEKFIDLYQDDLEEFFSIFQTLDQGGTIDISGVENPKMRKCLKKMFRYLPLKRKDLEYKKAEGSEGRLKIFVKEAVTKCIDQYMENGTDGEKHIDSEKQSSEDDDKDKQRKNPKKQKKKMQKPKEVIDAEQQKQKKAQKQKQSIQEYQKLNLYSQRIVRQSNPEHETIGPSISIEQRQILAKMFNQPQIKQQQQMRQQAQNNADSQFQRIFAMSAHSKRNQVQGPARPCIDDIPSELLAEGSAKIGEKQQIDPEEIQEYNKIHRPRKLIEEHQEMMKIGKYAETDKDGKKKRVPFDRERDIVYGRSRQLKNQGVFYDFSQRMTKPKSTNNFL